MDSKRGTHPTGGADAGDDWLMEYTYAATALT
jgi:hypothetical protein